MVKQEAEKTRSGGSSSPRYKGNSFKTQNFQQSPPEKAKPSPIVEKDPEDIKRERQENQLQINDNPLHQRVFTNISQTSTSIQVAWSHPQNFQKLLTSTNNDGSLINQRQHIQYILEYGIGVKVDNKE